MMEIEAKFSITSTKTYAHLMETSRLGGYALANAECKTLHDTYLDTSERTVMQAGYALRRRALPDSVKMTLKSTQISTGTVHRREEIEIKLAEALPLDALPKSPFRSRLRKLTGNSPVETLCEIDQRRCVRQVSRKKRLIAEMALDEVTLHAGERDFHLLELEIELKGEGTEADLDTIIAALTEYNGLVPQTRSKLERALALVPPTPPAVAVFDAPDVPGIKPEDSMAEAARKTLRYHLGVMLANQTGTHTGKDIDALHDMRVASRRMRAALRVFQQWVPTTVYANARKGLRRTGRALGAVRDLDVFRVHVGAWQHINGIGDEAMLPLSKMWNAAYSHARNAMLDYLESKRYQRFISEYLGYLENSWDALYTPTVAQTAPALIQVRINAVMAYADLATRPNAPLEHYHALRIEMKRLRYTLEFLREVLGKDVGMAIKLMKTMQDHLGLLQDAVVASAHLDSLLTWGTWSPPREPYTLWQPQLTSDAVIGDYYTSRQAEINEQIATFPAAWQRFASKEFATLIENALHNLEDTQP